MEINAQLPAKLRREKSARREVGTLRVSASYLAELRQEAGRHLGTKGPLQCWHPRLVGNSSGLQEKHMAVTQTFFISP